jgi:cell division protein FtsB
MKENATWSKIRNILTNKYVITLFVFAIIFIFVGEQSWINQISRKIEINKTQHQIQMIKAQTVEAEKRLKSLEDPDSLEHFARETYKMHTNNEDVYIVN